MVTPDKETSASNFPPNYSIIVPVLLALLSSQIGAVFLSRGIGAGLGNVVSPKLYKLARGKATISVVLFLLAANLLLVPLVGNAGTLHLSFLTIGFLTAITDAGCQLMTRRLHGSAAGPWLGANTVSFGLGGAFAPLIGWLTGSLVVEYAILATVAFLIGCFLVVLPRPDVEPAPQEVGRILRSLPPYLLSLLSVISVGTGNSPAFFSRYFFEIMYGVRTES